MLNFFAAIVFVVIFSAPHNNYPKIFGDDYVEAISRIKERKQKIIQLTKTHKADSKLIISVVFPELIRFSELSNLFETAALELMYIEKGSKAVDFSIGLFQMKPSFVEKIEAHTKRSSLASAELKTLLSYNLKGIRAIRAERIKRMKTFDGQLLYLICFENAVTELFGNHKFANENEKVKFFATAYNYSFEHSAADIQRCQNRKIFPYGSHFIGEQYAYSDIALYFYKNDYARIFDY